MKKHLKYLSYVIRHKWFVGLWCWRLKVPIHRALLHDWTKFLPCEWMPYVGSFHIDRNAWSERFNQAWNHHQKSNKHHWQYWVLTNDSDSPKHQALKMPESYAREMVADWIGAGRAITGKYEFTKWYNSNSHKQMIHPETRDVVEKLLGEAVTYLWD